MSAQRLGLCALLKPYGKLVTYLHPPRFNATGVGKDFHTLFHRILQRPGKIRI